MKTKTVMMISSAIALLSGSANAAVLLDFSSAIAAINNSAPATVTAGAVNPIVQNSTLARGSGINAVAGTQVFNSVKFTNAATIDTADYLTFDLAPQAGKSVTLRTMNLNITTNSTGPTKYEVRSDVDNYASVLFSGTLTSNATTSISNTFSGATWINRSVSTNFRIYGFSASNAGTSQMGLSAASSATALEVISSVPMVSLTNGAGISGNTRPLRGQVVTTGNNGGYLDSAIFDESGTTGDATGYVDVTGSLPTGSPSAPILVMLDLVGTPTDIASAISALIADTGPSFTVLQTGNAVFNDLAGVYAGTGRSWDVALSFNSLPAGTTAGSLDFSWDFTGSNVTVDKAVVVPEPTTGFLATSALATVISRRRRTR